MNQENKLDEIGFEFAGDDNKSYLCKMWEGIPWFFYKHPDGQWVSLKQVNQIEIAAAYKRRTSDDPEEEIKFSDLVFIESSIKHLDIKEKKKLYASILALVRVNYQTEAKDFELHPDEHHIMIDISRIRSVMFPNKQIP